MMKSTKMSHFKIAYSVNATTKICYVKRNCFMNVSFSMTPNRRTYIIQFEKATELTDYCSSAEQIGAKQREIEERRKMVMSRGLPKQKSIKNVKQVFIVASGKGGVGKSTTAVNLSVALKVLEPKLCVGLLDADVFGPSIPLMMNIQEKPVVNQEGLIEPLINYGIKCMSMGFLIDDKSPIIWRGLMVMSALQKLLWEVAWGPLDYLIVDTPPGTGDTHLSLIQSLIISGVLLVTTPQKAAMDITERGAMMFKKLNVPIAGIVENMSSITCPKCLSDVPLFGKGITPLADQLGLKVLQRIPLHDEITGSCDSGKPIVLSAPDSQHAEMYKALAKRVVHILEQEPINKE